MDSPPQPGSAGGNGRAGGAIRAHFGKEPIGEPGLYSIQGHFADGCNVLLTGASGYIGSLVLEKLLRSTSVGHVYLLLRPRRGASPAERVAKLLNGPLFHLIDEESAARVSAVAGDILEPGLGLSPEDEAMLVDKVDTVIHSAAGARMRPQWAVQGLLGVARRRMGARGAGAGRLIFRRARGAAAARKPRPRLTMRAPAGAPGRAPRRRRRPVWPGPRRGGPEPRGRARRGRPAPPRGCDRLTSAPGAPVAPPPLPSPAARLPLPAPMPAARSKPQPPRRGARSRAAPPPSPVPPRHPPRCADPRHAAGQLPGQLRHGQPRGAHAAAAVVRVRVDVLRQHQQAQGRQGRGAVSPGLERAPQAPRACGGVAAAPAGRPGPRPLPGRRPRRPALLKQPLQSKANPLPPRPAPPACTPSPSAARRSTRLASPRSCSRCLSPRPRHSRPSTSGCGASRTPTPWASTSRRRRSSASSATWACRS
jgi:hypothetical protein